MNNMKMTNSKKKRVQRYNKKLRYAREALYFCYFVVYVIIVAKLHNLHELFMEVVVGEWGSVFDFGFVGIDGVDGVVE